MSKTSTRITAISAGVFGLAVVLMPSFAFAATQDTTVTATIGSVLSAFTTSASSVDVSVTPTASGAQTIASNTVTISTNGPGYTLQLSDKDTNNNLVSGANNIPAGSGTMASPAALTANSWGYRVDGVGGFGAGPTSAATNQAIGSTTFAAVPSSASPDTIKDTSVSASSDTTTFWYSVAANTSQTSGTYTDIVTYTAVSK